MSADDKEPSHEDATEQGSEIPVDYLFVGAAIFLGLAFIKPLFLIVSLILVWLGVTSHFKKTGAGFMKRNLFAALAAFATSFFIIVVSPTSSDATRSPAASSVRDSDDFQICVDKGVLYFREIGSYPYLTQAPNQGRRAEDVAAERCERSTKAF